MGSPTTYGRADAEAVAVSAVAASAGGAPSTATRRTARAAAAITAGFANIVASFDRRGRRISERTDRYARRGRGEPCPATLTAVILSGFVPVFVTPTFLLVVEPAAFARAEP